jgi:tRNA dimethylallyltransferase
MPVIMLTGADAEQDVVRGLDAGANDYIAKPFRLPELLARVPHRLIDFLDPAERYSAARFLADARREIAGIHASGRVPLLVGGTMLYFRALLGGLSELPDADPAIRARLEDEAAVRGWPALHARLAELDPAAAGRIHPGDPQRIQRALEVHEITGRPLSELQQRKGVESGGGDVERRVLKLGLFPPDRRWLHERIERRFHDMMTRGLLEEVRALHGRGDLHLGMPAMRAVGYRQLWAYLDGECDLDEAVRRGVVATRQLAKRQMTWMRSEPGLEALEAGGRDTLSRATARVRRLC